MNRIGRTVLLAEMTADTSNGTCTHDILALVFGTALYEVHCLIWYKFNQMLRTCSHTFSAGLADLRIDFAIPSTTWIASNGHAFTQFPNPRHP